MADSELAFEVVAAADRSFDAGGAAVDVVVVVGKPALHNGLVAANAFAAASMTEAAAVAAVVAN